MSEPATTMIVAALAALWILVGVVVSVIAARRLGEARTVISAARSLKDLLDAIGVR